jgi:Raf kinase inhibitor-like YbhB/YbcL family protein
MPLTLTSAAFAQGGQIPREHTCEGDDRSPPLTWTDAPRNAKSFALIVDDPDAPDPKAPKRVYVHWVVYNIPVSTTALPAGASSSALPAGAKELKNDFGYERYGGPCPPIGRHRYFHKLYTLDTSLGSVEPANKTGLLKAMEGHVLAEAELVGTYQKQSAER